MEGNKGSTDSNLKGESSGGTQNVLNPIGNINPNARITIDLFNGKRYRELSYSPRMAIGGVKV